MKRRSKIESMTRGPPYLPLYAGDFLAMSAAWSGEARALHLLMLVTAWAGGGLPTDPRRLAGLLNVTPRTLAEAWRELAATPEEARAQ